jgi:hypothetical protein
MTDQERYLFDLQGYLVVPDALTAAQITGLNAMLDERMAREVAPDASTHRFMGTLDWGQPFVDLLDNPAVEPHLAEILGDGFRVDHVYLDVIRSGLSPIGATLHGGGTPFDRVNFYDFRNGRMYSGLFVVAYNLADVGAEDGGFACVPGSHKSNYPFPDDWKDLSRRPPFVQAVTGPAGTAVLFTEALTHGALPWSGAGERRTLFYKYHHHGASWASTYPVPEGLPVTESQRRILEPPHAPGLGKPLAHAR